MRLAAFIDARAGALQSVLLTFAVATSAVSCLTERPLVLQRGPQVLHPRCGNPPLIESNTTMKRYVIERDIAGVGSLNGEQLKGAAATSNAALAKLSGKVQWVESFVADDKPSASIWPTRSRRCTNTPS